MRHEYTSNSPRRIRILRDIDAHRLAAGEVIDRPAAVLRELLDNAIDAGSTSIDVYITDGGLTSITVIDNGSGMDKDDLSVSVLPHATSKISTIEDLDTITSLGFRGEALASIAACSRLEIISTPGDSSPVYRLTAKDGNIESVEEWKGKKGTKVTVGELFHTMPGRRKFLKSSSAEGTACRYVFIEKALPFPEISFKLFMQNQLRLYLPPVEMEARIKSAFPVIPVKTPFLETSESSRGVDYFCIHSYPELFRRDRKYIQIFVNHRRIQEYAFVQAAEHAYSHVLPGGAFPYVFLFLEIDPRFIDFNIHPTKREARFKNKNEIHHSIVELIRKNLTAEESSSLTPSLPGQRDSGSEKDQVTFPFKNPQNKYFDISEARKYFPDPSGKPVSGEPESSVKYHGQAFGLFLIAETDENIYFVDQHAAHERMLFDKLQQNPPASQPLLVPAAVSLDEDKGDVLISKLPVLEKLGIRMHRLQEDSWEVTHLPGRFAENPDSFTEFLKKSLWDEKDLAKALFDELACKSAVKDGELIDHVTALELIEFVLSLDNPRCPHGRPLYHTVSRSQLRRNVGRTL